MQINFMKKRFKRTLFHMLVFVIILITIIKIWPSLTSLIFLFPFFLFYMLWRLSCPDCGWIATRKKSPPGMGLIAFPDFDIKDRCINCGQSFIEDEN